MNVKGCQCERDHFGLLHVYCEACQIRDIEAGHWRRGDKKSIRREGRNRKGESLNHNVKKSIDRAQERGEKMKMLIRIDGTEYRVLADPKQWAESTKRYLVDCGHEVEELGTFEGDHEITDGHLSDLLEPRDE